ncbi:MAG: hypothetical protein HKN09_04525 [Saprospiraceae bacterium]|nr:hypothetical protein [Saprospiraceae bacterium]
MTKPSKWFLLRNPEVYQGWNKSNNYFEGWYLKIVDPEQNLAFALIPGISKSADPHAFVQFIDGVQCKAEYYRFDRKEFSAQPDKFEVKIKDHLFSEDRIVFRNQDLDIQLEQSPFAKLKTSLLRPGIMGWYAYMPFMQCYHGLVSMNHSVTGNIRIRDKSYSLNSAKAYIEKDWGVSFPKAWIWNQCNSFEYNQDLSVFASVAHIPWLGHYFIGFIAAIHYKGKIQVFATYNYSKRETKVVGNHVTMTFTKGNKCLQIESIKEEGADLKSPLNGEMLSKVNESLLATMKVRYSEGGNMLINETGNYAGMELAGPVDILLE